MDNKKIGITLVVLSLILGGFMLNSISGLQRSSEQMDCNPTQQCEEVASGLGVSHIAIGALGALLSLGIYMIFFNASERAILERLESEKQKALAEERLAIMLQALDESEKKILRAITEQEGITQKMLTIRTGLSKAKVSQVVSSFEKKGIIKRNVKGRTYSIYLTRPL